MSEAVSIVGVVAIVIFAVLLLVIAVVGIITLIPVAFRIGERLERRMVKLFDVKGWL